MSIKLVVNVACLLFVTYTCFEHGSDSCPVPQCFKHTILVTVSL